MNGSEHAEVGCGVLGGVGPECVTGMSGWDEDNCFLDMAELLGK